MSRWSRISGSQLRELSVHRGRSACIFVAENHAKNRIWLFPVDYAPRHPRPRNVAIRRIGEGGRSPPLVCPRGTPLWAVATVLRGECTVHFHVHQPSTRENFVLASPDTSETPGKINGNYDGPRRRSRDTSNAVNKIGGKSPTFRVRAGHDRRHSTSPLQRQRYRWITVSERACFDRRPAFPSDFLAAIPTCPSPNIVYREDTSGTRRASNLSRSRFERVTARFSCSFDQRCPWSIFSRTSFVHVIFDSTRLISFFLFFAPCDILRESRNVWTRKIVSQDPACFLLAA